MREKTLVLLLLFLWAACAFFRLSRSSQYLLPVLPESCFHVTVTADFETSGSAATVRVALPSDTLRQRITGETFRCLGADLTVEKQGENKMAVWRAPASWGEHTILYSFTAATRSKRFRLPERLPVGAAPQELQRYLLPSEKIQSEAPEIERTLRRLIPEEKRKNAAAAVRAIYRYCAETIRSARFKGSTDAVTCLRLGEGSCGGKARLFVALCRSAGIPARVVKGLILKNKSWRATHIWAEALLCDRWVPFCPLNGHFAEIPASYLAMHRGDAALFTHTPDINFNYLFAARKASASFAFVPPEECAARGGREKSPERPGRGSRTSLWRLFTRVELPLGLLKVIVMIPAGALVLVVARTVVGIGTFGTFMPVLMAVAFRDTGLLWGLALFGAILLIGAALRWALEGLQLLHTPRLSVVLTAVVLLVALVTVAGRLCSGFPSAEAALFPLAVLTLTVERFVLLVEEDGLLAAFSVCAGTACVVAAAYGVMNCESFQLLFLTFPETLLGLAALFVVMGKYRGLRLSELIRFRTLLSGSPVS